MRTLERLDLTDKSSWTLDNAVNIAHQLDLNIDDYEEFEAFLAEFIQSTVLSSNDNCTSFLASICINCFYRSKSQP